MKKVLITGAKGMLGQDLCPILEDEGYDIIETDSDSLDITDSNAVNSVIEEQEPDIVINCAAYTNVDKAEEEPQKARLVNALGCKNLAEVCAKNNIVLVSISTDYVFDGTSKTPYTPLDKTNPVNIYGLTKLEGENFIKNICNNYYIVRTSWLYGHHGKNFVETMLKNSDSSNLKVVDDQIGCPTWTIDLAKAIINLINKKPYGVYHICGSGYTSRYEFAREIFKLTSKNTPVAPCKTEEYLCLAKRPAYSVMNNEHSCRDWKLALKDYLSLRPETIEMEVI